MLVGCQPSQTLIMKIYKQTRGVTSIGIGWELVGLCDDEGKYRWRIIHLKIDAMWWHIHFDIPYTFKTPI